MEGHLHGWEGVTVTVGLGLGSAGQFAEGVGTWVRLGDIGPSWGWADRRCSLFRRVRSLLPHLTDFFGHNVVSI